MQNIILYRDLTNVVVDNQCHITTRLLHDTYTGKDISFTRGASSSAAIQINYVVALSDAWQKGA